MDEYRVEMPGAGLWTSLGLTPSSHPVAQEPEHIGFGEGVWVLGEQGCRYSFANDIMTCAKETLLGRSNHWPLGGWIVAIGRSIPQRSEVSFPA